ncbi:MAG: hypothetical protein AAFV62_02135 [Pseudomonadota bacterium]
MHPPFKLTGDDDEATMVACFQCRIEVPTAEAQAVLDAVRTAVGLAYGAYDSVAFTTAEGTQQFRPLDGSRVGASETAMRVPCVVIGFSIPQDPSIVAKMLAAARAAHPYQEPVITLIPAFASRADYATGQDDPTKWWNREKPDWLPHDV